MNETGAALCHDCPAGFRCTQGDVADACPQGFYCPAVTGLELPACPVGMYGDREGLFEEAQCTLCTGGSYCDADGLTEPAGFCDAGFYCVEVR